MAFYTLKKLVQFYDVSLNPATINLAMKRMGLTKDIEYISTTGSGEIKTFVAFTDKGEKYGFNRSGGFHPFKTECRFYAETFPELIVEIGQHITKEGQERLQTTKVHNSRPLDHNTPSQGHNALIPAQPRHYSFIKRLFQRKK